MTPGNESTSQNNNISRSRISVIMWFSQVTILWTLISVAIWLSLKPVTPVYMITHLHVPALNKPANSTIHSNELAAATTSAEAKPNIADDAVLRNTSIILHFEISNPNKRIGIHYRDINVTLYYNRKVIGTKSHPGFYQGYRKTTLSQVGVNVHQDFRRVMNSSAAMGMRVCLETAVSYKIFSSNSKYHVMDFEAYVVIGSDGRLSTKENILLHRMPKLPIIKN